VRRDKAFPLVHKRFQSLEGEGAEPNWNSKELKKEIKNKRALDEHGS
jgi:hypothetical protein